MKKAPELRVIPRIATGDVEAMLEVGAEGAIVQFADEVDMRDFAPNGLRSHLWIYL